MVLALSDSDEEESLLDRYEELAENEEVDAHHLAVERREIERAKRKQQEEWETKVYRHRVKTRTERLQIIADKYYFWWLFGWTFSILVILVFLALWLVFQFALPSLTYGGGIPYFMLFRLLFLVFFVAFMVFISLRAFFHLSQRALQSRIILDPLALTLGMTLLVVGAIFLPLFGIITGGTITGTCGKPDPEDTRVTANICLSWTFWFGIFLFIGICWTLRNIAEEILLYKLDVRPDNREVSIAAVKEYCFRIICKQMRRDQVIPKRGPRNKCSDIDVKGLKHVNEYDLLNLLDRMYKDKGRRVKVDSSIVETLRDHATLIFLALDKDKKGYLEVEDFEGIFPSERGSRLAYLIFNSSLRSKISEAEFVLAVEDIYTSRRNTWQTYNDRLHLAVFLRIIIGGGFWAIMMIIIMIAAGLSLTAAIIPLASLFLSLSFAFGSLMSSMVESVFLLLLDRPFDVGDFIRLGNDAPAPSYGIAELGWFRTIGYTASGLMVSIANTSFFTQNISNFARSKEFIFYVTLQFRHETPGQAIVLFKESIEKFMEDHPDDYHRQRSWIHLTGIEKTNIVTCSLRIAFNGLLWSDYQDVAALKLETLLYIQKQCKLLGITYNQPAIPIIINKTDANERRDTDILSQRDGMDTDDDHDFDSRSPRRKTRRSPRRRNTNGRRSPRHASGQQQPQPAHQAKPAE